MIETTIKVSQPVGYVEPFKGTKIAIYDVNPSLFHRVMMRLFFGWKFTKVNK